MHFTLKLFIAAAIAAAPIVSAQPACQTTQVTGTLTNADNSLFDGVITISWPAQTIRGTQRPGGSFQATVRSGAVNVSLCASQTPYTVTFNDSVSHSPLKREWVVPPTVSGSASLANVQVAAPTGGVSLGYTPAALDAAGKLQASQLPATSSKQLWPSMLKWRSALASCNGSIAVLGDSIAHGVGANPFTAGWAWQLNNVFAPRCGQVGAGLYTAGNGDGYTFTGTWTPYTTGGPSQSMGVALSAARTASASATAQVTLSSGTIYDIWYYTDTDTAAGFKVQVDGGAATTYGAVTSAQPTIAKATVSGLTYFPHIIKVTAPTTGNIHLLGISSEVSTTSGIQVYNVSTPSASTEFYNGAAKLSWLTQIPNLSLIIYPLGTNDVQLMTPAQTQANITATISWIQANLPNVPILFVTEPPRQQACTSGSLGCQADVDAILRATAATNGYPFLSLTERWGNWTNANAAGLMFDGIHPSTAGHADYSALVADFLAPIYTTGAPSATGTLSVNMGAVGAGLQVLAPTGSQALATIGDGGASGSQPGTALSLKYNKAVNAAFIGPTGGTDTLYLQSNSTNRLKIDSSGQIFVVGTPTATFEPWTMPSGSVFAATSIDPGCTQTSPYNIGRVWFDNTTNTTVMKVCMSVNGVIGWVAK